MLEIESVISHDHWLVTHEKAHTERQSSVMANSLWDFIIPSSEPATKSLATAIRAVALWWIESPPNAPLRLLNPLVVVVTDDNNRWFVECSELGIYCFGSTEEDALKEFQLEFAMTWDSLRNDSDDSLTADAQRLKNRFRSYIETPHAKNQGHEMRTPTQRVQARKYSS